MGVLHVRDVALDASIIGTSVWIVFEASTRIIGFSPEARGLPGFRGSIS